jgi:hypothetical protein
VPFGLKHYKEAHPRALEMERVLLIPLLIVEQFDAFLPGKLVHPSSSTFAVGRKAPVAAGVRVACKPPVAIR